MRTAGTALDEDVLHAMRYIRLQRWIYLRNTHSHSIFLDKTGSAAYGALGLTWRLRDITGASGMLLDTALLNYRGQIICDALMASVAMRRTNLRRDYNRLLTTARAEGRYSSECLFPRAVARPGGNNRRKMLRRLWLPRFMDVHSIHFEQNRRR